MDQFTPENRYKHMTHYRFICQTVAFKRCKVILQYHKSLRVTHNNTKLFIRNLQISQK